MADDTPRLGLGRFEQGDSNWDHTDTVEAVDEHAIDRGPVADRPDAGEYDDELYYATDQSVLWGWNADASNWTVRGGTGSSDQPIPTFSAKNIYNDDRPISATAKLRDGEIIANGEDDLIASGDASDPTDVRQVLQAALDYVADDLGGGRCHLKQGTFTMDKAGTDAEGSPYCLEHRDHVILTGEGDATVLEYPAVHDETEPDVATPILCSSTTGAQVKHLKVDGGYHHQPQSETRGPDYNVMGIKVGLQHDLSTSCYDTKIIDVTITGAYRHGIEASGGSERGLITECLFDDASGDDDVSISVDAAYWTVTDSWSINKVRDGNWTTASFELEDGAIHCVFRDLYSIEPVANGIAIGKSHLQHGPCDNNRAVRCHVIRPGNNGFNINPSGDGQTTESIHLEQCEVVDAGGRGVHVGGDEGHTVEDLRLGVKVRGATQSGINFTHNGATFRRVVIPEETTIRNVDEFGVVFRDATDVLYEDIRIEGPTIEETAKDAILFAGDETNYAGDSIVRDCRLDGGGWLDIKFNNDPVRQFVRTLDNDTEDDFSPVEPANPAEGMEYYDDGTNTDSGTKGKRAYLGGGWVDAWTA